MLTTIAIGTLAALAVFAALIYVLAEISFRAVYAQACDAMRKIETPARARYAMRVPVSETLPTLKGKIRHA